MKKFLLLMLSFYSFFSYSQNLIPNGDFELGPDSSSVGWVEGFDSTCTITDTVFGPDFWSVISGTPDRLVEGNICSNWSDDTAQSGKAFIHLYIGNQAGVEQEAGSVSLIIPLEKDSSYQLSYYASMETIWWANNPPSQILFVFNNEGDSLASPLIYQTSWQYHDTIFIASAVSTEIEIKAIGTNNSGTIIDNIVLKKVNATSLQDFENIKEKISIYPNPTQEMLFIKAGKNAAIRFYDVLNNPVNNISGVMQNNLHVYDLSFLTAGIYFVNVISNKINQTQKILIIK